MYSTFKKNIFLSYIDFKSEGLQRGSFLRGKQEYKE